MSNDSNKVNDIAKQFGDNTIASAKKLGELNLKTFEAITLKQAELVKSFLSLGTKHFETSSKAKDFNEFAAAQQDAARAFSEAWVNNLRETGELLNKVRDELTSLTQEAFTNTQTSAQQVVDASKQVANENIAKAQETIQKVADNTVELTQSAADNTVDAAKKAAERIQQS